VERSFDLSPEQLNGQAKELQYTLRDPQPAESFGNGTPSLAAHASRRGLRASRKGRFATAGASG
jgi:hypothetical protein